MPDARPRMAILKDRIFLEKHIQQELRQVGHYMPVASNKIQHINWLLYNSVLRI